MDHYKSLHELQARSGTLHLEQIQKSASDGLVNASAAAGGETLSKQGISAEVSGSHIYFLLSLKVGFTTTNDNKERKRAMSVLAEYTQGFRKILNDAGGLLLEPQGGMIHGFLPEENPENPSAVVDRMVAFVRTQIKPKAGDAYLKCVGAYCSGDTIFVTAPGSHDDPSIVSLSNAANAPAKFLYKFGEGMGDGSAEEISSDLKSLGVREISEELALIRNREAKALAASLSHFSEKSATIHCRASPIIEKSARAYPGLKSGDQPTVEEPTEVFTFCLRADIEGFTRKVARSFQGDEQDRKALATEFFQIMTAATSFGKELEHDVIQMPWAGDSFNLLIIAKNLEHYDELREEEILRVTARFEDFMKAKFPEVKWSFAVAAGEVVSNQVCNTLVSRVTFPTKTGQVSHILTAGKPVQRALDGQINGGVNCSEGTLWKEDKVCLSERYSRVVEFRPDNPNHHLFSVGKVRELINFKPVPSVFGAPAIVGASIVRPPQAMPYYNPESRA